MKVNGILAMGVGAGCVVMALAAQEYTEDGEATTPPVNVVNSIQAVVSSADSQSMAQETFDKQFSYIIGYDIASRFGQVPEAVVIDPQSVARGVADGLRQGPALAAVQMEAVREAADEKIMIAMARKRAEFTKRNDEFLSKNSQNKGVKVTSSGLQYVVLREGTGRQPQLTDTVRVHYAGSLVDGTEFDSSYSRGAPAVFVVQGVIDGWKEALLMMKEGDKWKLYVPANLGYGGDGDGEAIPPGAVLIFELELLAVV